MQNKILVSQVANLDATCWNSDPMHNHRFGQAERRTRRTFESQLAINSEQHVGGVVKYLVVHLA